jgi:hypothetical protein
MVLNRHKWGLPPWNLGISTTAPHPSLSSAPLSPIYPIRHTNNHEHKPLLITTTILLVHKREVLHASGTYHSTCTDVYQLNIAYLVK